MPHRVQNIGTNVLTRWRGSAHCADLHAFVLEQLKSIGCVFQTAGSNLNRAQIGNLGEFICLVIERNKTFPNATFRAANALRPLNKISNDGVDIIWVGFETDPQNDFVVLQEVKTTAQPDLSIHHALIRDYRKLFSQPSRHTLSIILQGLKSHLVLQDKRPDLATRLTRMAGVSPSTTSRVFLMPTIVHDLGATNIDKAFLNITTAIMALQWPAQAITPRSVALNNLSNRLQSLSEGS